MAFDRVWGDKIRKKVILDTSAILMCFEFSVDWERELSRLLGAYDIVVPTEVVWELETLAECEEGQRKRNALGALKMIQKYQTVSEVTCAADEAIMKIAQQCGGVVVTNDSELRKRLLAQKTPVVFLRGKKRLALEP